MGQLHCNIHMVLYMQNYNYTSLGVVTDLVWVFFFKKIFTLFILERERKCMQEQGEGQGKRRRETDFPLSGDPTVGLHPKTPRS